MAINRTRYSGNTAQPAQHRNRINEVKIGVEYLGAQVKLLLEIDKKGFDKEGAVALDLVQLRTASVEVLAATLKKVIDDAMAGK